MRILFFLSLFNAVLPLAYAQHPHHAIRVGTNVWPGYEPFYLARSLKYFENDDVKLVEFLSASEVLRAFRNRDLEAAALTLDEALILVGERVSVRIILVTDVSHGGDAILAKPEIKSLSGLKGKRIGVEGSAVGAYLLARGLELQGMAVTDVRIEQLEVNEHEQSLKKGKVDAVVTFEPVRSRLLKQGARELFSSREIPNEIIDVLVVQKQALDDHPDKLARLVGGWFAALRYLDRNPKDAARRISKRLKIKPEEVIDTYSGMKLLDRKKNIELLSGDPPQITKFATKIEAFMLENQLLSNNPELEGLFDQGVLMRVRP